MFYFHISAIMVYFKFKAVHKKEFFKVEIFFNIWRNLSWIWSCQSFQMTWQSLMIFNKELPIILSLIIVIKEFPKDFLFSLDGEIFFFGSLQSCQSFQIADLVPFVWNDTYFEVKKLKARESEKKSSLKKKQFWIVGNCVFWKI